jgi:chromosomal replication initiation ATPase DnaA
VGAIRVGQDTFWAERTKATLLDARTLRAPVPGPAVVENVDSAVTFAHEPFLFAMLEQGTPLLLTGRGAPAGWPVSLPDLRSRFGAMLAFELGASDEALLMALAVKLFADRQLIVPESVVTHLVRTLERSPAALRDFIQRADGAALAAQKPVNLQLIRGLMED